MESGKLSITTQINVKPILDTIEKAETLDDNEQLFRQLAPITVEKKKLEDALEQVAAVEREVKQKINDRAKAIIGTDWTAIKGNGYKITRGKSGAVYEIVPEIDEQTGDVVKEPAAEFITVKILPNTEAIDEYREANSALPECIAVNESRGESIRISVRPE